MTTPYHDALHLVVDRLRDTDIVKDPPAVLVVPEEDEPDVDRPSEGNAVQDKISAALGKAGIAIVVYIESVDLTSQRADQVEIRVQVIESVVKNRHESGTKKPCWTVLHAIRSSLDNFQSELFPMWTPLRFAGFESVDKSLMLIREARFFTQSFVR